MPAVPSGSRIQPWLHRPVQLWAPTTVAAGSPVWQHHCRSTQGLAPGGPRPVWAKSLRPPPMQRTMNRAGSSRPLQRLGMVGPGWGAGIGELGPAGHRKDGEVPEGRCTTYRARRGLPEGGQTSGPASQRPAAGPGRGLAYSVRGQSGRLPDLSRRPNSR